MRDIGRRLGRGLLWVALALWIPTLVPASGAAQGLSDLMVGDASDTSNVDPLDPAAITQRFEQVAAEQSALARQLASASAEERARLESVRTRLDAIANVLRAQAQHVSGEAGAHPVEPAAEPAPSVFLLFSLYEEARLALAAEDPLAASRSALGGAKVRLADAEQARRRAKRALADASGAAKTEAARALHLRELESRLALERVHLHTLETREAQRARDEGQDTQDFEARIREVRQRLARGEGEMGEGVAILAEREGAAQRVREAATRRLATAELRLSAARKRFSQQADPSNALLMEVEATAALRDAIAQDLALADAQLERLAAQREVMHQWDALLRGNTPRDDLQALVPWLTERAEALETAQLKRQGRVTELERRLAVLGDERADHPGGDRVSAVLKDEQETLRRQQAEQLSEVRMIATDRRLTERVLDDVRGELGILDPIEFLTQGVDSVRAVWRYEITSVADDPITVGSLVLALVLVGIGVWTSRRGSAGVGRFAQARFRLDEGAANALQTLSFYAFLVGFSLLALRAVHFPLTAFTVLGGAVAIGIGFGSQNVMNNFISGLILMLERPVRVRDVVEVDGNHGTIENIGARSTQIRATDGRHIIVPNSFFLESNVVNWTLSDDLVRARVTVGVIYGSPTRQVEALIQQAVRDDARVLDNPKPIIIFEEFGDNALLFDSYFWVRARSPMEMRRVQSEIRFRIDDLFREHGLVIAFPQRDVHLDSVSPIEVRMVKDAEPG